MSFKVKVFLNIIIVVGIATAVSLAIHELKTEKILWEQSKSKSLTLVSSAVDYINGDDIELIHKNPDENSEAYKRVQASLRNIRDRNRRDDIYVSYVYTLRLNPENPNIVEFGVDAEETRENHSRVGDVYRGKSSAQIKLKSLYVDETFTEDQWGKWLTASAPILNSKGTPVAGLFVDVPAQRLINRIANERASALYAFGFAVCLAVLASALVSRLASKPLHAIDKAVKEIEKGNFDAVTGVTSKDEFGLVASSIEHMAQSLKQHQVLKSAFASYVSNQVMDNILTSKNAPNPQGERRAVTVLFSDIRGFTDLAENLKPEMVVDLLNEYFERMIDVVFRHDGTLDKFIGDGLMAIFGAPNDDPDHEEKAVKAALDMQKELVALRNKWAGEGKNSFQIGIGINSGKAIVGNIGSSQRLQYTAIGDTVNIASRLESATKDHGVEILISEYTYNAIRRDFNFKKVGSLKVKGRNEEITAYAVNPH